MGALEPRFLTESEKGKLLEQFSEKAHFMLRCHFHAEDLQRAKVAELETYQDRMNEKQVILERFHEDHQDDAFGVDRVRELETKVAELEGKLRDVTEPRPMRDAPRDGSWVMLTAISKASHRFVFGRGWWDKDGNRIPHENAKGWTPCEPTPDAGEKVGSDA